MSSGMKELPIRNGYPELAKIMGSVPGMALFKRFSSLSAHNLLYKQAELLHLGERLQQMDRLDRSNGLAFHKDASAFMRSAGDPGVQGRQARMMAEIGEKLKEYHETLLRHVQVSKLERANGYDLNMLRDWLLRCNGDGIFPEGIEARPWENDEEEQEDLVALSSRNHDVCTKWVAEKVVPWLYD
ncbi:uncharacterized protein BKCO1_4300026 [Diplodia corticola]|uniref:DUF6594 domain-containing protein n=1 Tax=Diplodia corticola TaxID=236234 RepID=A0A1J9QSI4_9PEZI|nr:uncharacterized protein BKCO1_4300026 [Diplodia corticola]OJD31910.1 hypothetical protein BKCO1_4300026 [Diplodia corticola]